MNNQRDIKEKVAYAMLAWMTDWVERFLGDDDNMFKLGYRNSTFTKIFDLLAGLGVVNEHSASEYTFITPSIDLQDDFNFEHILVAFYSLGDWYGFGVKFQEQRFKVSPDLKPLFGKLVKLGYCEAEDEMFLWTQKSFGLAYAGSEFRALTKDEIYAGKARKLRQVCNINLGQKRLNLNESEALGFAMRIGLKPDSSPLEIEQALYRWWEDQLKQPSVVWPASIPLEKPRTGLIARVKNFLGL